MEESFETVARALGPEVFRVVDGQRIHVVEAGDGPQTLLLLHGFAASVYSFRDLIPRLAGSLRVVALDLNGFGYTERPRSIEDYGPERQLAVVRHVLAEMGVRRCHLLGHSYGALLALLAAAGEPEAWERLVLVSPVAEFDPPPRWMRSALGRRAALAMARGLLARPAAFRRVLSRAFHREEVLSAEVAEAYRRRLNVEGFDRAWEGFTAGMRAAEGGRLDLSRVPHEALVLAGRHDRVVPLERCRRAASALPAGRLQILEKSGHSSPEEEPDAVAVAIRAFLRGEPGGPGLARGDPDA